MKWCSPNSRFLCILFRFPEGTRKEEENGFLSYISLPDIIFFLVFFVFFCDFFLFFELSHKNKYIFFRSRFLSSSYPEGNFEGNQLLDGSVSLSPLCQAVTTRFARQESCRLPPQFPMASSSPGIDHQLSGPTVKCFHSEPSPLDFFTFRTGGCCKHNRIFFFNNLRDII